MCLIDLMNTPSASADGFSGKLCGDPLAWRLTGRSIREVRQLQHNLRRGHVAVEKASLRSPARIDQHDDATGACSLVAHMLDDLVPRGVMD